ncbi:hypothetical protein ACVJGC_006077 [Bradyrhizobium diazoefficiens]
MVDDHDLHTVKKAWQVVGSDRGVAVDADRKAVPAQQFLGHRGKGVIGIDEESAHGPVFPVQFKIPYCILI